MLFHRCSCITYLQSLSHSSEETAVLSSFNYSSPLILQLVPTGAPIRRDCPRLCAPAVPVGGPARGLVGERGVVPAASAADISVLFIKRMTTLSSPISGPSCTGVLLLLSGRVSSILLPCYSLELLMANTIPPFSAWPLPPRSLESGVARGVAVVVVGRGGVGGLSPRVPFLDRRQSGLFGHRGSIYGTM